MTAAQNFSPAAPQELEPPPLLKVSFVCFCIFLLANYSRLFEWHFAEAHVPLITAIIALMGAAMEGRLAAVFGSRIGMCMTILTVLYTVNIPLSTWRRGSVEEYAGWLKTVLAFAIAGAIIFNLRQCRTALNSIGWATGIAGLLVNWQGASIGGRLSFGRGSFGNSNAIAFGLLIGLPFLILILQDSGSWKLKRLLALCAIASNLLVILRTGSRGGLIGLIALCLFLFLRSSMTAKLAMMVVGGLAIAAAFTVLPRDLKLRYQTILSGSEATSDVQNSTDALAVGYAESSSAARRQLLINSLKVTLSHPLFGVGIGQFGGYMAGIDEAAGRHSGWQGTHNTYTQISSEAGIPALIAFVCLVIFSIQGVRALSRRAQKIPGAREPAKGIIDMAFALTATLLVYAVCICFDYIAYGDTMPILAGFTIALIRCGNSELDRLERAPVPESQGAFLNLYAMRPARAMRPAI